MPIDYVVNESRFVDKGVKFTPQKPALIQYLLISASHPKTVRLVETNSVYYGFDWESAVKNLHGVGSKSRFLALIKELAQEGMLARHKSNRPGKQPLYCFTELFFGVLGYQHVEVKEKVKKEPVKKEKEIAPFFSSMPEVLKKDKHFLEEWIKWVSYKSERGQSYKERGVQTIFNKVVEIGTSLSIEYMEESRINKHAGWFFKEKHERRIRSSNTNINNGKHKLVKTDEYDKFRPKSSA